MKHIQYSKVIFVVLKIINLGQFTAAEKENAIDIEFQFHHFGNSSSKAYSLTSPTSLPDFDFDPLLIYVVLCHGWTDSIRGQFYTTATEAFRKLGNSKYVVIQCGYAQAVSNLLYYPAVRNVPAIGEKVGEFITSIITQKGVPSCQFKILGHSLGAHIAGYAGDCVFKAVGTKVGQIFGLDPAEPGFSKPEVGLQKTDSYQTIIFHTSNMGISDPRGHVDFYPNNGMNQPFCITPPCDHAMAFWYLVRSINTNDKSFIGLKCDNYFKYILGACSDASSASMSFWVSKRATGIYYVSPNFG